MNEIQANRTLSIAEKAIRSKADDLKEINKKKDKLIKDLSQLVDNYNQEKDRLKKEIIPRDGMVKCMGCKEHFHKKEISLVYIEKLETHGDHYCEQTETYKYIWPFCQKCARLILTGKMSFSNQLLKARAKKTKKGYFIYRGDRWQIVPKKDVDYENSDKVFKKVGKVGEDISLYINSSVKGSLKIGPFVPLGEEIDF